MPSLLRLITEEEHRGWWEEVWGIVTEKKRGCVCLMPEKSTVQVFYVRVTNGWKERPISRWWKDKSRERNAKRPRWRKVGRWSETGEMKWRKRVGVGPREGRLEVKWMTMIGHTECWGKSWQVSSSCGVELTWEKTGLFFLFRRTWSTGATEDGETEKMN